LEAGTVILHADADAFFVACHLVETPSLRGRPVVVAGDPQARHGVVLSASYEARRFGVRGAMPLQKALTLYPRLMVVAPDHEMYAAFGRRMGDVFASFSPAVERLSIDEAWLDMTGGLHPWHGDPRACAADLKAAVKGDVGVVVSVGVAPNKYLAKQASELEKPDGLVVLLDPDEVERRLWPLPVGSLYGCGSKTAARLTQAGIRRIGDLASASIGRLAPLLGSSAEHLRRRARGEDEAPVAAQADALQSVGAERTLARDVAERADAEPVLLALADEVASRLRALEREAHRVVLKYRTAAFRTHTHQRRLSRPTAHAPDIYRVLVALFEQRPVPDPVRLLGVQMGELVAPARQTVLGPGRGGAALDRALDDIRRRYGQGAIRPARLVRHMGGEDRAAAGRRGGGR
jgi:DNA polymerase IV